MEISSKNNHSSSYYSSDDEMDEEKEVELVECKVCLMDFDKKKKHIKCLYPNCVTSVCEDCVPLMVDFSLKEKVIPKCPQTGCKGYFTRTEFEKFPSKIIKDYDKCCFLTLMKEHENDASKELEQSKILERMREERKIFIDTSFPPAISKVAKICLSSKLKKLEKKKRDLVDRTVASSKRLCMNLACRGHLNSNFVCLLCNTAFCKDCEKRKEKDHKCKEEEKESLNFIRGMIKCPKCLLPIQRSEGCNNMTCASCGTKFLYDSGKEGGYGGHSTEIKVKDHRLSTEFKTKLESLGLLENMEKIELIQPVSDRNDKILINIIRDFLQDKKENIERRSARAMEKHLLKIYYSSLYADVTTELERRLSSNSAVIKSDFEKLYDKLKNAKDTYTLEK